MIDTPKFAYNTDILWSPIERLRLSANARYTGSQYTTQHKDQKILGSYWTLGANANYDIVKNFTIRGGISNMFNKQPKYNQSAGDYYSIEGRTYFNRCFSKILN